MLKLSQEDKESVLETLSEHGCSVLINIIEQIVKAKGLAVLTHNEPERILAAKAKYDGANELLVEIKSLKERLQQKKKS